MIGLGSAVRQILFLAYGRARRRLRVALADPRAAQQKRFDSYRHRLPALAGVRDYEDFATRFPVTTYVDYRQHFDDARAGRASIAGLRRFETTSGSTEEKKFFPYTAPFLAELDEALGAWMGELATRVPAITHGPHYWSLSWVPELERRTGRTNDDTKLFPAWKRPLLSAVMAVPPNVALEPTNEAWRIETLKHLVLSRDLSLISVWSPTFLTGLLATLDLERDRLADGVAARGRRGAEVAAMLRESRGRELHTRLWPSLAILSCWEGGASTQFARALVDELSPTTRLQGKGLWATEGVVTIPVGDRKVPALTSHFLEFLCESSGRVFRVWELDVGQRVRPLLTTAAGLVRYDLGDRLYVRGLDSARVPDFEFEGRARTSDLVGEKLAHADLATLAGTGATARALGFIAVSDAPNGRGRYHLLCERDEPGLAERIERALLEHHHYRVARELGQLEAVTLWPVPDAAKTYAALRARRDAGAAAGQIKLEAVISISHDELARFRSHDA